MASSLAPTIGRLKTAGVLALSPLLRRWTTHHDHAVRLAAVRRVLPGSTEQIPEEIVAFAEFAAMHQPRVVCEIGTLNGGTSLLLCGVAPSVQRFIGIDLNPCNGRLVSSLAPRGVDVTFIRGSSSDPLTRTRLTDELGGHPVDLLFIDGDHRYGAVRSDFVDYRSFVRPNGLIGLHDIVPDVAQHLGVPRLWKELYAQFSTEEFVRDWKQDGLGIGVVLHDPAVVV